MLLAMFPARLLEYSADPARLDAWLNLSQREKATLLVMVRTRAIAIHHWPQILASILFLSCVNETIIWPEHPTIQLGCPLPLRAHTHTQK